MTERALSGRRIIVLGGPATLGHSVTERFRVDGAAVVSADVRLPAEADRQEDVKYIAVDAMDEASVSAALAMTPAPGAVVNLIGGHTRPPPASGAASGAPRDQAR